MYLPKENRAAVVTDVGRVRYVRDRPSTIRLAAGQGTQTRRCRKWRFENSLGLDGVRQARLGWTGFGLVSGSGLWVSSFVCRRVLFSDGLSHHLDEGVTLPCLCMCRVLSMTAVMVGQSPMAEHPCITGL